ncbi:MAG: CaiB/BaiF CoA transferase family protein [Roseiflexaceae bacterium]|jgi:formyl-CoA transferase
MQPLTGLRVLDMTRALTGPYCTQMLGDMGADIIKVEQPKVGDNSRAWGPPFVGGESTYYLSINRNKRSMTLDLRHPDSHKIMRALVVQSDIVIENFVPGHMTKYGFDYDACKAIKPDIIYCSISGFGQSGPDHGRAAYDQVIQGLGGVMSVTGYADGDPMRVGIALSDLMSGMNAAYAILAAVIHRMRTGVGQYIDTSLLSGQLAMMSYHAAAYLATGVAPKRTGNHNPEIAPYGVYQAKDGWFNLAVGTNVLWQRFCDALHISELCHDPRFATNHDRSVNYAAMNAELEKVFLQYTMRDLQDILIPAGVPIGEIHDMASVFADPQVKALDEVVTMQHPTAGEIRVVGAPYRLTETPATVRRPPPTLGQHTEEVLVEIGFDAAQIAAFRASGVLG